MQNKRISLWKFITNNFKLETQRARLTAALFLVSVIPLGVMIGYQAHLLDRTRIEEIQKQQNLTELIASELRSFVEMHRRGIEAATFQIDQNHIHDLRSLTTILESLKRQFPGFINLYVANNKGVTQAFFPEINSKGESMVGVNFSGRWHYQQLLRNPKTYISPVMKGIGGTEKLLCTIVSPFFDNHGNFDGFVLGALNLDKVGELIKQLNSDSSIVLVVDALGQGIYASLGMSAEGPQKIHVNTTFEHTSNTQHFLPIIGAEVFTTSAFIAEPQWRVLVSVPVTERNALLHNLFLYGLILFISTVFAIIFTSRRLSERLSDAIEMLSKKAALIKEHRFSAAGELKLSNSSPQETLLLAKVLDDMGKGISESHDALQRLNGDLEARVKMRTAFLRAILRSLSDPFFIIIDQQIPLANRALKEWLFSSSAPENLQLSDIQDALADKNLADLNEWRLILDHTGQVLLNNPSHTQYWLCSSFPVEGSDGHFYGLGVLFRDISREKRLDQLKDSLLAVAAHEFKTPITSLKIQAETLARQDIDLDKSDIDEMVVGILEDTERLEHMVRDWLDISKIDSGNLTLFCETDDLLVILTEACKLVQKSNATLEVHVTDDTINGTLIQVDHQRMLQVFINLLTNACRYCDGRPSVNVILRDEGSSCLIEFHDNGIGISHEEISLIFEKFHQVDSSATRRAGGTGLGLAIARGIAQAHGGNITVKSTLGKGSVFTVSIPRHVIEGGNANTEHLELLS